MEEQLIEGRLQLKNGANGWRHFIKNGEKDRDIHCATYMEVKLIDDNLGGWLPGRYEARLTEPVEAHLVIGDFYPGGKQVEITIPLGRMVRVRRAITPGNF